MLRLSQHQRLPTVWYQLFDNVEEIKLGAEKTEVNLCPWKSSKHSKLPSHLSRLRDYILSWQWKMNFKRRAKGILLMKVTDKIQTFLIITKNLSF